jgi:putative transposase
MKPYANSNREGIYFLTFATVGWVDILTHEKYSKIILESLRHCQREKGLEVHAWCIMSSYMQLMTSGRSKTDTLSEILDDFQRSTSNEIIRTIPNDIKGSRRDWMLWVFREAGRKNANNMNAQFWRQSHHPQKITSKKCMDQKLDYIHSNPVKAGLASRPEDYLFSSARDYHGKTKGLLEIRFVD